MAKNIILENSLFESWGYRIFGPVFQNPGHPSCVLNESVSFRCCIRDGSRPTEIGVQALVSNQLMLLHSKGVVVSDECDGASNQEAQVCIKKMSESEPTDDPSKIGLDAVKTEG